MNRAPESAARPARVQPYIASLRGSSFLFSGIAHEERD